MSEPEIVMIARDDRSLGASVGRARAVSVVSE
jgi:hypothetical protein